VSNFKLVEQSALNQRYFTLGDISVQVVKDQALVSFAIPNGKRKEVNDAIKQSYNTTLPKIGLSVKSETDHTQFLGMQAEQFLMLFNYKDNRAVEQVKSRLNALVYLCDQSDSWVMLRIRGKGCRTALERICAIDLYKTSFPQGSVARTTMEHLAVIILHESDDQYLLMSPRSSAESFLHSITQSIENIS